MSDREAMLTRIRACVAHAAPHPGPHPATALPASFEAFAAALRAAGGEAHAPLPRTALAEAVQARARAWAAGGRVVVAPAATPLLGPVGFETAAPDALPHGFADVALAIAPGCVGVAESGAVAVRGCDAPRALLLLAERLLLLLDARSIVGDLHAGFRALPSGALDAHHLTWIAGPSKSADIEQTLVLGAHGPRAVAVFTTLDG